MLKKYKYLIFISLVIFFIFSINTFANGYTKINDNSTYATVTQIIDGDAIKVKLSTGESAYVKLAGITANGYDEAYEYLIQKLLGANVFLVKDGYESSIKWNYMLVYYNGKNINEDLLERGYAIIDNTQDKTSINNALITAQSNATAYGNGVWTYSSSTASTITGQTSTTNYAGNKININTATQSQLKTYLRNIDDKLASAIILYREKNPFSTIEELKFVEGITRDIYNQNKNIISVSTNINTATYLELKSLRELSDTEIDKIIEARIANNFTKIESLKELISSTKYSNIEPYISISDTYQIYNTINSYIANINGAERSYLIYTGLSSSDAEQIIAYRKNGYTYKTLGELLKLPSFSLTEKNLNYLEDNLQTMTNLNPKNKNELESIFSSTMASKLYSTYISTTSNLKTVLGETVYNKVKDYVYVDTNTNSYINLNTATQEQLTSIGLTYSQAKQIINARPITNSSLLPFNIADFNTKVSLYTNINTASDTEIQSLNSGMTSTIINNIKSYVKDQPFGSLDEVETYFASIGQADLYKSIKNFIVVR